MRIANSIKLNDVSSEVIQLQLFPFSLRDMAVTWFNSLPHESVNTWEELMRAYFSKFFTPSLSPELRFEITNSKQGGDENKYTSWKDLAEYNTRPSGSSERNGRAEESGMNVMDKLTAMEAKLDSIMHRIDKQEKKTYSAHEIVAVEREEGMEELQQVIQKEEESKQQVQLRTQN